MFKGASSGAMSGFMVGNLPGALVGTAFGALAGDKIASVGVGYDRGAESSLVGGRAMVMPSGDLFDPWEGITTGLGAVGLQQYIIQGAGGMKLDPIQESFDSADRVRLGQNLLGSKAMRAHQLGGYP